MEKLKKLFKNKKFLMIFVPTLVLVLVLGCIGYYKLSDRPTAVEIAKAEKGAVKQYYDTTGTLSSGYTEKFYIYEGVKVKEVKVKTGDTVSEGDVLATFDTSSMNSVISEKKEALNAAQKNYNDAVAGKKNTAARSAELSKQIKELQAQKDRLESAGAAQQPSGSQLSDKQIEDIIKAVAAGQDGITEEQINALREQLQGSATAAQNSTQALDAQIQILESEKAMVNTGQYDSVISAYKKSVESARTDYNNALAEKKALDNGWVATREGRVADVFLKEGEPYVYVEDASERSDLASLLSGGSAEGLTPDLSEMLSGMMQGSGTGAKKGVGITVDYFEGYKITFNLGKYDAQTIRVGMPAIVKYTDFEYEAEVSYMSPHAENGSSALTSMMGGTVSNSSGNTLPTEATIKNPDDKLILGFDAKLSILTAERKDVLRIPVEALIIEDGKKYVYIYDEDTKTAVKKEVEAGISSETHYEIKTGLKEGDKVIVNSSKVTDGASVTVGK